MAQHTEIPTPPPAAIPLRHAYRYLKEAAQLEQPVAVAESTQPITFKISGNVIRAVRAYAAAN